MKVLLVAKVDYAYMGYTLSQCLKTVGVEAEMLVRNPYPHRPGCGTPFTTTEQVKEYADQADIIQFMHSQFLNIGVDLSKKRIFVYHGGSNYRLDHKEISDRFNPIVEKSIIQTGDLLGLGAKNEVWLLPAVDTDMLKPVYKRTSDKIVISHFPSTTAKNTAQIEKVVQQLIPKYGNRFEYISDTEVIRWDKHIERVSMCDIYIEACTPIQQYHGNALKYGEWGVAGIEAAALGKIVITHFLSHKRYTQEYGKCELCVANEPTDIATNIEKLLALSDDELLKRRKATRAWVEKFHSLEAVGTKLKEKIYEI